MTIGVGRGGTDGDNTDIHLDEAAHADRVAEQTPVPVTPVSERRNLLALCLGHGVRAEVQNRGAYRFRFIPLHKGETVRKKTVGVLASAALLLVAASAPAAWADSTAPLSGAESICLAQGGTWYPSGFGGFEGLPVCTTTGFAVLQKPGSYASTELVAVDRLCKAAGFDGVRLFGKGIPTGGFFVETWVCA
jgi:hypothetical protein